MELPHQGKRLRQVARRCCHLQTAARYFMLYEAVSYGVQCLFQGVGWPRDTRKKVQAR